MQVRVRRGGATLLAVLATAALAVGCGDDESTSADPAGGNASAPAEAAPTKLETTLETSAGELKADGKNSAAVLKAALEQPQWGWPVDVLDCSSDPEGCEDGEKTPGIYRPMPKASKEWNLCLLVPYMDPYWLAINYGVVEEAKRMGAKVTMQNANGYANLPAQINQLNNCVARGSDAVLLAAVSAEGLNAQVKQAIDKGIPVIDLGNGITSESVPAHAAVTYYTLGKMVGSYLASKDQPLRLGWFPGPAGAAWAETSTNGVKDGIKGSQVELVTTKYAASDKSAQLSVVQNTLESDAKLDYMGGASVAAEASVPELANRKLTGKIGLVADYVVPATLEFIREGKIECASSDTPVVLGRIAVDQAIRLLDKQPMMGGNEQERVEPRPVMACGERAGAAANIDDVPVGAMIAPDGFKPSTK
jgi:protein TorT